MNRVDEALPVETGVLASLERPMQTHVSSANEPGSEQEDVRGYLAQNAERFVIKHDLAPARVPDTVQHPNVGLGGAPLLPPTSTGDAHGTLPVFDAQNRWPLSFLGYGHSGPRWIRPSIQDALQQYPVVQPVWQFEANTSPTFTGANALTVLGEGQTFSASATITGSSSSWVEGASGDSPAQRLEETRRHCLRAITSASNSLSRDVVNELRRQIASLLDPEDWDTSDMPPSVSSFQNLVTFLGRHNELRAPALTISNSGSFVATWLRNKRNMVRLEFIDMGWVKWLVFLAPIGKGAQSMRGTATVPVDAVKKALGPFDVWAWMT